MQPILIVGGAGYIGSHMLLHLKTAGYQPIVLDNLSTGHREAVLDAELIVGDMNDAALLSNLFSRYSFSAVMHFAACIEVGESVRDPLKYYKNNVAATITLLEAMQKHQIETLIFSSTAAVYGLPNAASINEAHPLNPINPYGRSKLMIEQIIQDLAQQGKLHYAILRYFNAAGADAEARIGECHQPESHLIPLLLQVARGERKNITVFGVDYPTIDGTCVRDYIHVDDLCAAHLSALNILLAEKRNLICNLGLGHGYTVLEVINKVRQITGHSIPIIEGQARAGDPPILVADAQLAYRELKWQAQADLAQIITHAWQYVEI